MGIANRICAEPLVGEADRSLLKPSIPIHGHIGILIRQNPSNQRHPRSIRTWQAGFLLTSIDH
jgi:hypothetical protein